MFSQFLDLTKSTTISTERNIPTSNKQRFGSLSSVIGNDCSMAEQESGLDLYYPQTKYPSHSQQCSPGINASLSESCDPTSVLDRRSLVGAQRGFQAVNPTPPASLNMVPKPWGMSKTNLHLRVSCYTDQDHAHPGRPVSHPQFEVPVFHAEDWQVQGNSSSPVG